MSSIRKISISLVIVLLLSFNSSNSFLLTSAHVSITYDQTIEGLFTRPMSVLLTDNNIYVVDDGDDTVKIFNKGGVYVSEFGGTGTGGGLFTTPHDIETNGTHLFVSDWGVSNIQVFDLDGTYVKLMGGVGTTAGKFFRPATIHFNGTNILVADSFNDRIQIFDANGNYVSEFDTSTEVETPFGVASNYTHIFVADYGIDQPMEVYDSAGTHLATYGSGQLRQTVDVEIHGQLKIVSDSGNGKMWVYNMAGENITHYGEGSGLTNDRFNQIKNIDSNSTHLAVADSANSRIQIFALDNPYIIITLRESTTETETDTATITQTDTSTVTQTATTVTETGTTVTVFGATDTVTETVTETVAVSTATVPGTETVTETSTAVETQVSTITTEITSAKSEVQFPSFYLIGFMLTAIVMAKRVKIRK
ncbi:MAG: 6-bladed beta-propeller [Candidatus Heimdallarchaeota archaeon]|nr:6-bladed beta-propeller [Candidatus Heimdallarchaeota archaeon]